MRNTFSIAALAATFSLALSCAAIHPAAAATAAPATAAPAMSSSHANMQAAVKKGIEDAQLTPRQKMQIAPMVKKYQTDTANATASQKTAAQKTLLKNIYGVMTPDQQAKFKASVKSSMGSSMPQ
jgi:Spy/CpxP family protein refolding chaperone